MSEYELTYIIQPDADDEKVASIEERVAEYVTGAGGAVSRTLDWGRRHLAYPIKHRTSGVYVTHRIELESSAVDELQYSLRYNEDILRHLILTTDDLPDPPPPAEPAPKPEPSAAAETTPPAESDAAEEPETPETSEEPDAPNEPDTPEDSAESEAPESE